MKAVILAGGRGLRFDDETTRRPKPMIEIGGKPMLWHIMSVYRQFGIREFVVCLGYRGEMIRDYFRSFLENHTDITVDLKTGKVRTGPRPVEDWRVTLVDTGLETNTGGRLKRVAHLLDSTFLMTYGDGLSDVDIAATIRAHRASGKLATVTAVQPPGRWGALRLEDHTVTDCDEKPERGGGMINGGYFVLERRALDFIDGDATEFERHTMKKLAVERQLNAFVHEGFWHAMDTAKDRASLEAAWNQGDCPWLRSGRSKEKKLRKVA